MAKGRVVKAKPTTTAQSEESQIHDSLYMLCYHYPQYTLQEARELPYHQVLALLDMAGKQLATHYAELLNISAAPHTKKGSGVKKLSAEYRKRANG